MLTFLYPAAINNQVETSGPSQPSVQRTSSLSADQDESALERLKLSEKLIVSSIDLYLTYYLIVRLFLEYCLVILN